MPLKSGSIYGKPKNEFSHYELTGESMLTHALPIGYSNIENEYEAVEAAYPTEDRQVRVYIVWDNAVNNLPLREVLEKMRETGAAMVTKVEPIK